MKDKSSLPKGWEMRTVGDVCERGSSNVSQNQLDNEVGDYPIFGASGLIKNISFYRQQVAECEAGFIRSKWFD